MMIYSQHILEEMNMRPKAIGGLACLLVVSAMLLGCLLDELCNGGSENGDNGTDTQVVSYDTFDGMTSTQVWSKIEELDYGQIPVVPEDGYYAGVDSSTPESLRSSLHARISGHETYKYTESGDPRDCSWTVDLWDIVMLADQHPDDEAKVLDLYKNGTYERVFGGIAAYNREHSWPKSRGFDSKSSPAYTDAHHLFACDWDANTARNNSYYGSVDAAAASDTVCTDVNLGRGGDTDCNYGIRSDTVDPQNDFWQVWSGRKGDVARAMFYMGVRYEGDATNEPDLELTSDESRQETICKDCYLSGATAYMGLLDVLLEWHAGDPVDDQERRRNTIVYLFQGNRNPFVDHPEWVSSLFGT